MKFLNMLLLLKPTSQRAETKVRQTKFPPTGDPPFPLGFAWPNYCDTSLDPKTVRISARRLRFPVNIITKSWEFLWRAEVKPAIGLPPDATTDTLDR